MVAIENFISWSKKFKLNNKNERLVIFDAEDHISFITNKIKATEHTHHYIQLTIGVNEEFYLGTEGFHANVRGAIIDSNVSHRLDGNNCWQYYMLINPESNFGLEIKKRFLKHSSMLELRLNQIEAILDLFKNVEDSSSYRIFIRKAMSVLEIPYKSYSLIDRRCKDIINIIKQTDLNQLTVPSLAQQIYLSESRLSHLFKKEVGITISSYLVHEKMRKAFRFVFDGYNLTDAAIKAGFSSSSHFSRCVREKLGMSPLEISKNSRYMKV